MNVSALGPHDVRLCWIRPEDAPPDEILLPLLDAEERARHARFMFARHRRLFLVAHALVRSVLSAHRSVDPAAWRFSAGPYGRPEVQWPPAGDLRFNLSHADGMAVCIATLHPEAGVDVEPRAREVELEPIARRFFAPAEVDHVLAPADEAERHARFLAVWTLKEAYLKARGIGLGLPLDQFAFSLSDPVTVAFGSALPDDPVSWRFRRFDLGGTHLAAVGTRAPRLDVEVVGWRL